MRKPTGVYIYLGRELYESIKAKASKKDLTAGEFCAKLIKKEALRSHTRGWAANLAYLDKIRAGLEDAKQGKVSRINLNDL
jgi:hypothetical protein